ncbi:insulinase family protein [Erwinia sp. CPCC 100877]|nr:insulinase family protein [Erwinia sp. CPCC 100877]
MQGTKMGLIAGVTLLAAITGHGQAAMLQPDPAWQQGKLSNGFQWQVLATPQRPSDRIEIRLRINTGSLTESTQQSGYSHLLPRLALSQQASPWKSTWQQGMTGHPQPPAVVSYNFTQFNLSLPGGSGRSEPLKEALSWLAKMAGELTITPESITRALEVQDGVATWPKETRDSWWRYRLKGSTLLGHDPAAQVVQPVDAEHLKAWYRQWYTPDAMTLIVVGNVDSRRVAEQVSKLFGDLEGKRETPAPVPTLSPLKRNTVSMMDPRLQQDRLSMMWDAPWQPIRTSEGLMSYWRGELAREALFWHVQQNLSKNNVRDAALGFDCRVLFLRAQCAIHIDTPNARLDDNLGRIARDLARVRDLGLPTAEFETLLAQKKLELEKLFAAWAHTRTEVLIGQRLRSLQNQVVDIAPEQYQKLRQAFLDELTPEMVNMDLRQMLSQEMALVLQQPEGEPEFDMKRLREIWDKGMSQSEKAKNPPPAAHPVGEVSDIPGHQ